MNLDDIIKLAKECGLLINSNDRLSTSSKTLFFVEDCYFDIERFAELVRADERNSWPAEMEAMERQVNILTDALAQEREACAKVCVDIAATNKRSHADFEDAVAIPIQCAAAIRARSNT